MSQLPYVGQAQPDPTDVAIVVAAASLLGGRGGVPEAKPSTAWRFSGRWWELNTGAIRPRP